MNSPIICALDFDDFDYAILIAKQVKDLVWGVKVGMQLFYSCGFEVIKELSSIGCQIFLDLKLHDIPNTIANTIKVISRMGVNMVTIHISGGVEMIRSAVRAAQNNLLILGVTLLTSMSNESMKDVMINSVDSIDYVENMSILANKNGLNGVICSSVESGIVRSKVDDDFVIVCPGVRMQGDSSNDHNRVNSPKQAIQSGANYVVIGRPITSSRDPRSSTLRILEHINYG